MINKKSKIYIAGHNGMVGSAPQPSLCVEFWSPILGEVVVSARAQLLQESNTSSRLSGGTAACPYEGKCLRERGSLLAAALCVDEFGSEVSDLITREAYGDMSTVATNNELIARYNASGWTGRRVELPFSATHSQEAHVDEGYVLPLLNQCSGSRFIESEAPNEDGNDGDDHCRYPRARNRTSPRLGQPRPSPAHCIHTQHTLPYTCIQSQPSR